MVLSVSLTTFEHPIDRIAELGGAPGVVRFLELAPRRAVVIDGDGAPGPDAFTPRLPGLYATAYSLRFGLKARGVAGKVGPLEGLWWMADGSTDLGAVFSTDDAGGRGRAADRRNWRWILLIGLPDEATDEEIARAVTAGRAKLAPPFAANLRIEALDEGRVAQLLHVGPYAAERPSIERLHAAVEAAGLHLRGRHHEIYLGNPRMSAPERLRTILRHPVG